MMVVWENCGNGLIKKKKTNNVPDNHPTTSSTNGDDTDSGMNSIQASTSTENDNKSLDWDLTASESPTASGTMYAMSSAAHTSKYGGSLAGWVLLSGTLGLTVTTTYYLYSEEDEDDHYCESLPYILNIFLSILWVIVACGTFSSLTKLTFFDEELRETAATEKGVEFIKCQYMCEVKHKMDHRLSTITLLSLTALKIFSFIAGLEMDSAIIITDAVVSILFAAGQNLFLSYAENKRIKTHQQLKEKPGLSGLEFLRIVNFALWINNSFLLKNPAMKTTMNSAYGYMQWAVLSNIFQPLTILYYFHAMITVAEVISHVYTHKFVGVIRRSKQKRTANRQFDNTAFEFAEL